MAEFRFHKTIYGGPTAAERILEQYRSYLIEGVRFKKDILHWLDEQCHGCWAYREEQYDFILIFNNDDDAALFKLTWLGNEEG